MDRGIDELLATAYYLTKAERTVGGMSHRAFKFRPHECP
jgi:hypothetical protein